MIPRFGLAIFCLKSSPAIRQRDAGRHPRWLRPFDSPLLTSAIFAGLLLAIGAHPARAQTCTIATNGSGQPSTVSQSGGSCTIPSGQVLQMPGFFPLPGPTQLLATAGGVINGSNLTIYTTPSGGAGSPMLEANGAGSAIYLDINSAGTITGSGSTLTENVFGGSSVFLQAQNSGLIEAYNLTQLFPTGGNDIGAQALSGGAIILIGGSLTVDSGGGNVALQANGGTITATGTTFNLGTPTSPNGGNDIGAQAIGGGTITLTDSSVNVYSSGSSNTGLLASGAGSAITTNNVNVTMENPLNPPHVDVDTGVEAAAGASVTMTGGTVAVNGVGNGEKGLWATGAGSVISASDIAISVPNGNNGAGVQADTSGTVALTGNSTIATGGTNNPGGLLMNGGTISMDGGSVTTTGAGSAGFAASGGGAADALALTDVTVSAAGASFDVNGSTANITLTDTIATVNNGTVLSTESGGTTTFDAGGSQLEGVMTTAAGSTSNVTLHDATTWTMTGNSNVTNLTNDDSLIDYTAPSNGAFKTLTAVNYTGEGGTIGLNTYLGADGSPSDLLVINGGAATGSTVLRITNADGPGAATQANGIEVVSAVNGATTASGAYWTHYGPSGWYLDAVAQATRYDGWTGTQFTGLDPAGTGIIGSLEAGYPFALPVFGPGFVLEPQAQIIGQHVEFGDTEDEFGDVALGTTNGATGRMGGRARWTLVSAQGQEWQPYLRANFWRDWGGDATTVYSGVDEVPLLEEADRLELGGGLTVKMSSEFSLYANGDYQSAVGDTDGGKRQGARGALGLRYAW